jgi:hypothetical protein
VQSFQTPPDAEDGSANIHARRYESIGADYRPLSRLNQHTPHTRTAIRNAINRKGNLVLWALQPQRVEQGIVVVGCGNGQSCCLPQLLVVDQALVVALFDEGFGLLIKFNGPVVGAAFRETEYAQVVDDVAAGQDEYTFLRVQFFLSRAGILLIWSEI